MEFMQYQGVDWAAMVFTFVAIWQIGNKNKYGFILMMIGNLCWIGLGFLTSSMAMIAANSIFLVMNARAIVKWSKAMPSPS